MITSILYIYEKTTFMNKLCFIYILLVAEEILSLVYKLFTNYYKLINSGACEAVIFLFLETFVLSLDLLTYIEEIWGDLFN